MIAKIEPFITVSQCSGGAGKKFYTSANKTQICHFCSNNFSCRENFLKNMHKKWTPAGSHIENVRKFWFVKCYDELSYLSVWLSFTYYKLTEETLYLFQQ